MVLNYYLIFTIIICTLYVFILLYMIYYSIRFIKNRNNNIISNREPFLIICYNISYGLFTIIQIINDFKLITCKPFEIFTTMSILLIMNFFILRGISLYLKHFFTQIKINVNNNKSYIKYKYKKIINKKIIIIFYFIISIIYLVINIIITLNYNTNNIQDCYNGPNFIILATYIGFSIINILILIFILRNKKDNIKIRKDLSIVLISIIISFCSWLTELIPLMHNIQYNIFPYSEMIYIICYLIIIYSSMVIPLNYNNKIKDIINESNNYKDEILYHINNDLLYDILLDFSKKEFTFENILFCKFVENFKIDNKNRWINGKYIIDKFIKSDSILSINIDHKKRIGIDNDFQNLDINENIKDDFFNEIEDSILKLIYENFWKRFVNNRNNKYKF